MPQLIVGCPAHLPTDSNKKSKSWSDNKTKKKDFMQQFKVGCPLCPPTKINKLIGGS